jgi:hypothetical protein
MPSRHGDDKLLGAWLPPEFAAAVAALADAHGVTRSELIRAALLRAALEPQDDPSLSHDEAAA